MALVEYVCNFVLIAIHDQGVGWVCLICLPILGNLLIRVVLGMHMSMYADFSWMIIYYFIFNLMTYDGPC